MALDRKCDKCGKPSASEVRVDIVMMDVVTQGRPTGTSFVTDACPDCRAVETERLFRDAFAQLTRDIPRHKELHTLAADEAVLNDSLTGAVSARDAYDPKTPEYRAAHVEVDKIQAALAKNQERRAHVHDDNNYKEQK